MEEGGQVATHGAPRPGSEDAIQVEVILPVQLRDLIGVRGDVTVELQGDPTVSNLLDALEAEYPALRGTIRDHGTGERRAYVRYFACGQDVSHEGAEMRLPEAVIAGQEGFRVLGAISGG